AASLAAIRAPLVELGGRAWESHGCQVCHGAHAEGGMGPVLAGGVPSFEILRERVRRGSTVMPAFGPDRIGDDVLRDVHAWLLAQPKPRVSTFDLETIEVPDGVDVALVARGLENPVTLAYRSGVTPESGVELYVSTNGGWYPGPKARSGAIYRIDGRGNRHSFLDRLDRPMGMVWVGQKLYVSTRTQVSRFTDADGDGRGELERVIVDELPGRGMHHAGGLVLGPDRRLYLGMGTRTNASTEGEAEHNGTILSFGLDGEDLQVFARGFRNPFDLAFAPDGALFATDNAADPPAIAAAVEELNHVVSGAHYGHPFVLGDQVAPGQEQRAEELKPVAPVVKLPPHTSANGILYYTGQQFPELQGRWLIAEYGSHLKGYADAGRRISVVKDVRNGNPARPGGASIETWARGFQGRPLDLLQSPEGEVLVTDFFHGTILRFFKSNRRRERARSSKVPE
ncbi:MAG TPA: PQQ-dependent sugar dehydrogenase, partial [Polyangiaceae bacterium]|nr:PQQ-dependent sugar dehydrogenase [Polyangiaceae bacterium]